MIRHDDRTALKDLDRLKFNRMLKALHSRSSDAEMLRLFQKMMGCIAMSRPSDVVKTEYEAAGQIWTVFHGPTFKMTLDQSGAYNCFFSKLDGFNIRFGKTVDEDPECCELGPATLDLEVAVNGCAPLAGSTVCKYCYKGSTAAKAEVMSFDMFADIVKTFPTNLAQIAFGITSLKANPDLLKMFEYCRKLGIVPNVTTTGSDMDNEMLDGLCRWCGAVAVSCHPGAAELCYKTVHDLHEHAMKTYGRDLHVNMHLVVSKDCMPHVRTSLEDIIAGKVNGLKSVVFLRLKPKGRAAGLDCTVTQDMYEELVKKCLENDISFGFDSCSAYHAAEVLKKLGRPELCRLCEPCESSKLSAYVNVKGQYWSCSFAEDTDFIKPIDVLKFRSATEWWNSDEVKKARYCKSPACKSCPIYALD